MADTEYNPFTQSSWNAFSTRDEEEEVQPLQPAKPQHSPFTLNSFDAHKVQVAQPAIRSLVANVGISPEEYKGAKAIAKDVGVHARMLIDGTVDKGQARSQQLILQTKSFIAAHPKIAKFLEDPDKVALTYDDLDQLRRVAASVQAIKSSEQVLTPTEAATNVADTVANAAMVAGTGVGQLLWESLPGQANLRMNSIRDLRKSFTSEQRAKYDAMSDDDREAMERQFHLSRSPVLSSIMETGNELRDEQARLQQIAGTGVVGEWLLPAASEFIQMLPPVLATVVTRNPSLGAALTSSRIVGLSYSDAVGRGLSPEQATAHAAFFGVIEYLTEKIPLGKLLEQGGGAMTKMLKTAGAEAIQEGAVEVITILYDYGIFDETTTVADAFKRVGMSMAIGGTVGVAMSSTSQGIQATLNAVTGSERPNDHATALKQAKEEVDKAKLNVRDPEVMREALDVMSEDGTVFVAAEDLIELQQSGVLTQEDVANLNLSESVEDAAGHNADLEIKVSSLLTMPKDKFSELSQVVRESIASASSKESAQQLKDREATIAQLLEQMQQQKESVPDARPIYDTMRSNLIAVKGMSEIDANEVASMIEEQYKTIAAEDTNGAETAEELFLRDHITLRKKPSVLQTTESALNQEAVKRVTDRTEELKTAAQSLKDGKHVSREDYQQLVDDYKPVLPYSHVPSPATTAAIKTTSVGKTDKLFAPRSLKSGSPVGVRLDIPAYRDQSVWVVSIHEQGSGFAAGTSIGYDSVAMITGVTLGVSQPAALSIASGKPKGTIAVMKGDWVKTTPAKAKAAAEAALNDPAWVQVGMDPERHSFFYDRADQRPVIAASEVIQIGPLVLAKNPTYDDATTYLYQNSGLTGQRAVSSPVGNAPQYHNLTKADKKRIKELKKKVPGLSKLLPLLQPDEQALLTETSATNMVKFYEQMPSPQEMAAVALSGSAKRGWYVNSARALVEIFGDDAPRFAALLAALSPQTSVESNTTNALGVWGAWIAAGRPTDPNVIIEIMGENVQGDKGAESVLGAWRNNSVNALTSPDPTSITISGPKVNSFMLNLLGFVNEVTNDAWMANYTGVAQEVFASNASAPGSGKSAGYLALSARARQAANVLTKTTDDVWTGSEIQETIWSWAKALYEQTDARGETRTALEILKAGELTHENINAVPDFEQLFIVGEYRKLLELAGYGSQLQTVDASVQARLAKTKPLTGSVYTGADPHLHRAANRLNALASARAAAKVRSEIQVTLSATTGTITGLDNLHKAVEAGDAGATLLLQEIARDSLSYLTSKIKSIEIEYTPAVGLYDGFAEPSMGLNVSFQERDREAALAALAKFADNFNQEQVHVRGAPKNRTKVGHTYDDGSYNTDVVSFNLARPLTRSETETIINKSGLIGLTASDTTLEAYYLGDPSDQAALGEFKQAVLTARKLLGSHVTGVDRGASRLWAYGTGYGATNGYNEIQRDIRPPSKDQEVATAQRVASRIAQREVKGGTQAKTITEDQRALQERIAVAYEALPLNDLANPDVRRAYEELAAEVLEQYDALPIKVEVFTGKGEPYVKGKAVSSTKMRQDVLHNNHLFIFGTDVGSFGPDGVVYDNHPLLEDSGRTDENGTPMLFNDLFRAVHDYYAHTITPVAFGPKGEEAAWKTHMEMTKSPWARWALTSETRGQNSWANFRDDVAGKPLRDRPFAEQKVGLLPIEFSMIGEPDIDAGLADLPDGSGLPLEEVLLQEIGMTGPKGSFNREPDQYGNLQNVITLADGADKSTFLHEMGHFWLYQMKTRLANPKLTDQGRRRLEQQMTATKSWFARNSGDAWRDIQIIAKSAQENAASDPQRAKRLADAVAHAKANGGAAYMKRVAENFMDGSLDYSTDLEIGYHELWARGTEAYLFEGRAPSEALRKPMNKFSTWMIGVYAKIKNLNVTLDPEIRQVFDRLLATDAAINEERSKMLYQIPLELRAAATEKELQELDQLNVQAQTEAKAEMQGKVAKELLKERGAEYTAAKEKITAEVTEEVMSQPVYAYGRIVGQGVLTDGTEVKPGKPRLDRKEFEAIYGKDVAKKMPKYTFGKENIVEIDMLARAAGFDDVAHMISEMTQDHPSASVAIQTEVGRQLRAQFGSVLNPEQLTEDAEEVVQNEKQIELLALQAKIVRRLAREPIAKISKRKSLEEGAPSLDTDKIAASVAGTMEGFAETQGDAAPEQLRRVQIEEDTKANRDQRKAQSAAVKQVRQVTRSLDTEAIKEAAKRYVLKLPLGKLTPARFRQTAERLANKAQLAIAARKYDEAADLLQQRTLNLAIAREVAAAQTKATNTQRRHRRIVGRSDEKQGRDKDLVAIARSLLDKFGLIGEKRRGMPANEILARLKETDAALHSEMTELIAILSSTSDTYREADPDRPWRQMPLEEYIHLTAQIDAILKKALDEASILADGERVAFEQVGAEVVETTSDMTRDDRPAKARGGWAERVGMPTIGTIGSRLERIELWARRMDGGDDGPMQRYLVRPMRQAIDSYHQARNDLSKQMLDILMPFKDELARKVRIEGGKELDGYFFRSKGELIHFLLHTGNASNERKLLLGSAVDTGNKYKYRWTTSTQQDEQVDTAQLDAFITRMVDEGVITPADIKMMNELWALFEQTKPAAQKAHKAMHGHYFEEIEGTARRTAAGVMNGGYVPAVYDNLQIVDGQKREAVESMDSAQNAAMFPSTDAGFTKGRVDYNQPLNLDLSMIPLHLNKVLRFSHLGPAVRMASRLTINKKFQAAVGKVDKYAIANLITPWLQRTARQTIAEPGIGLLDRIYTRASRNVGLQTMAGNLLNAAQQMTGLITASAVVPPHLIAKHTVTWRKDGESVRKFIISKSRFMNNRMYDSVNDMSATVGSILTATTPWSKADYYAGRFGYFAQQMAQNVVDPIVWMAAYDQAVETTYYQNVYNQYLETHGAQTALERADAAAVLYADRVVRDTQTPLGPEDVSAAEGTTAFGRLFMKFSSYFNNMRSLSKTEFSIAARNLGTEAARPGRRFMIYLTVIAMPSIVAEGIMMLGRGEFDDIDEMDEEELAIVMGKLLILSQVKMVGNFVPGVGAAVNWGVGQFTDAQYDDRLSASPVISIVDSGGKSLAGVLGDAYDLVTEGETDRSVARSVADILNAFGLIVGLPTNWFKKPTAYLIKVSEGDARPDGPADIVQGLLSGRDGTE